MQLWDKGERISQQMQMGTRSAPNGFVLLLVCDASLSEWVLCGETLPSRVSRIHFTGPVHWSGRREFFTINRSTGSTLQGAHSLTRYTYLSFILLFIALHNTHNTIAADFVHLLWCLKKFLR